MSDLPKGYSWKRIDEGYYELRPARGKTLAEVVFIGKSQKWAWYVHMPNDWFNGGDPNGLAFSLEACKAVCEAIVLGTLDPESPS